MDAAGQGAAEAVAHKEDTRERDLEKGVKHEQFLSDSVHEDCKPEGSRQMNKFSETVGDSAGTASGSAAGSQSGNKSADVGKNADLGMGQKNKFEIVEEGSVSTVGNELDAGHGAGLKIKRFEDGTSSEGGVMGAQYLLKLLQQFDCNKQPDDELLNESFESFKLNHKEKQIMHRFPPFLSAVDSKQIVPDFVTMGPYHHNKNSERYKESELLKLVAAKHFITKSGKKLDEIYNAVVDVSNQAIRLYHSDAIANMSMIYFQNIMFFDALFLVEFLMHDDEEALPELKNVFVLRKIATDLLLLENQIPFFVVAAVLGFRDDCVKEKVERNISLIAQNLTSRLSNTVHEHSVVSDFSSPHLLSLICSSKISKKTCIKVGENSFSQTEGRLKAPSVLSVTTSAFDLAEIGIELKASKTDSFEFSLTKGLFLGELCITPLVLEEPRATWLLNMLAYELCTGNACEGPEFFSYLLVLAMLVNREKDVQELRKKHILQGLTNDVLLDFFKSLKKHLPICRPVTHMLQQIEEYQEDRWMIIKVYKFWYNHGKISLMILSAFAGVFAVLGVIYKMITDQMTKH